MDPPLPQPAPFPDFPSPPTGQPTTAQPSCRLYLLDVAEPDEERERHLVNVADADTSEQVVADTDRAIADTSAQCRSGYRRR